MNYRNYKLAMKQFEHKVPKFWDRRYAIMNGVMFFIHKDDNDGVKFSSNIKLALLFSWKWKAKRYMANMGKNWQPALSVVALSKVGLQSSGEEL